MTKAIKKKPKKKTIAQEVEKVATILQRLVRIKAADEFGMALCVSCGVRKHWKELQGGHFISRTHISTKILEENIHPQCMGCNGPRAKDSLVTLTYRRYMVDTYGEDFVKELENLARAPKKYTKEEVNQLKELYNKQLKALEENCNFGF